MPAVGLWAAWRFRLRQVRRKFAVVLAERERLAREIHDTLLQGMLGVALQLHGVSETLDASQSDTRERCERARDYLEHYIRETRQSICDLRSPALEALDLATALRKTATNMAESGGVRVSLQVVGKPRSFGAERERHVLRIGQEAITNAVRHASASEVRVHLWYEPSTLLLRVVDDGRGFDPDEASHATGTHWGLISMQERAAQAGALLELTSQPGSGTVIELKLDTGR
jgi:signal transduction histidine kinase